MAWTTSATSGKGVAERRRRFLKVSLLLAHIGLMGLIYLERSGHDGTGPFTHAALDALPATPVLVGLCVLLVLGLLATGRPAESAAAPLAPPAAASPSDTDRLTSPLAAAVLPSPNPVATAVAPHDGLMARLNHDLRTPLNAIIGFADLMQAEAFGPLGSERYRDYAAYMRSSGQDLLRTTETALAMTALLTRPNVSANEAVAFADLAHDAWQTATAGRSDASPSLLVAIPQEFCVRADLAALRQSLVCLFDAARLRSTAASRLELSAVRSGGQIVVTLDLVGARAPLRLAGSGCRPASSTAGTSIDELALCASRTLLSLQNASLHEVRQTTDTWRLNLTFEDAAQPDFFYSADKAPYAARSVLGYSPGFFAAPADPRSV